MKSISLSCFHYMNFLLATFDYYQILFFEPYIKEIYHKKELFNLAQLILLRAFHTTRKS
jgi:hypothetical protein